MKQLNLLKTLFLLCALMVGSSSVWAADTWEKTALADLTSSDVFVIVGTNTSGSYAMTNDKGTSSAPVASEVTINNDKITSTVNGNMKWNISGNATDGYTFYPNGDSEKWLYCTSSNNGVRVGTNDSKTFKIASDYLQHVGTSRYVGIYNSQDWRCYTSINSNITGQTFAFYKKVSSGGGKTDSDFALTGAPIALSFDLYNDKDAKVINYTTSSTGAVTVSESDYVTTSVDAENKTITVTPKTLITPSAQTITVSQAEDENYNAGSATFTVTITDSDPNAPGSEGNPYTVAQAIANCPASGTSDNVYIKGIVSNFYGDDIVSDGSNYRYYISDDGTTTNQLLVYKGKKNSTDNFSNASDLLLGDEVIIYGGLTTYSGTKEVASGNYIYSLTRKADPELIVEDDFSMEVTTTKNAEDLYVATSDGEVSFSSSAEEVANVVGGKLEAYAPGTATITVTIASTATYAAGSDSFVVTVTTKPAVDPEGLGAGEGYRLVTDASTLAEGDKLLFVGEKADNSTYVMGEQNPTNRAAVAVTIEDNVISSKPGTAQEVLLEGTTGNWYFNVGTDAYLYASAPTANNHLKTDTKENVGNAGKATISMEADGASTITFQCDGTRKVLQFNPSGLFSCYAGTQNDVYLYRYFSSTTFDITVDSKGDGWRTIVTAASATLPSGLKAYIASADESDKVTLTEVASLKANNAYILYGAVGDYTLTVTGSPVEPTGNELRVSTNTDGNGAFVLAKKSGVVGFYKWNGGSLGAGRVILPASAVPDAAARDFIGLGDATAISNVAVETKSDNRYYNLAGQVVAQPTKGLYIVNGKKVIIK